MKDFIKGLLLRIKTAIKPFLRVQMIISCFIPFCVVTLPAYVLPVIGLITHNAAITAVGTTWLGIIHLPICHESIVIIPIGLFIHTKLFPKDKITRYRLLRLWVQAKRDVKAMRERLKRGKVMADEKEFKYDPESEEDTRKYRLPFALCKARGIAIQDWWTPKNAWDALRERGYIDDVSEEYKEYYRQKKKLQAKQKAAENRGKLKAKKEQLADPEHNPDKNYVHKDGQIAGAEKGKPMTFEEADSGNCNPYISKGRVVGEGYYMYKGYRHNCQTCVATYFARRQGYDVRALPNLDNKNIYDLSHDTSLAYVNEKGEHPKKESKPKGVNLMRWLETGINANETCLLEWQWGNSMSGHVIIAEKDSAGELKLYDPQVNRIYNPKSDFIKSKNFEKTNLTGCRLDETFCDKIMKRK